MQTRLLTLIIILTMVLVACETTDSSTDALSAQNQQPAIVGFQTTDLDTAADAILTTTAGAAVTTGNVPLAVTIQRADALLDCLQETGAVSGLTYAEENFDIVPQVGASLIVNKTRVQRNVLSCVTDTGFSAQAIDLEPCAAYGEFTLNGEEFWFAYVGAGSGLCTGFSAHYSSLNATILGQYLAPQQ
ncbi:MAG: hypothetical protein AAF846_06540 [Chloroflexota bacterium]